jgi:hypothetical protein
MWVSGDPPTSRVQRDPAPKVRLQSSQGQRPWNRSRQCLEPQRGEVIQSDIMRNSTSLRFTLTDPEGYSAALRLLWICGAEPGPLALAKTRHLRWSAQDRLADKIEYRTGKSGRIMPDQRSLVEEVGPNQSCSLNLLRVYRTVNTDLLGPITRV